MRAYSTDLRERIVQAAPGGQPATAVARRFRVGVATVRRYLRQQRTIGSLAPKRPGGPTLRLGPADQLALREQVQATPDATLAEHCATWEAATGVRLSTATMSRTLARLNQPRKKSP